MSADSGIPTFRGSGGFWRQYRSQDLATPEAFTSNPGLVWQFYHYRRELVFKKSPNSGHIALANAEKRFKSLNRNFNIITQNVDSFHTIAGSENVIELHELGNLFKTRCTVCKKVVENFDSPICSSLKNAENSDLPIPSKDLPTCKSCDNLLRPHIVWFGESLDSNIISDAERLTLRSDICFVIGTSSVVYPAAGLAPMAASRGIPVIEMNLERTPSSLTATYQIEGNASSTVPMLFDQLLIN